MSALANLDRHSTPAAQRIRSLVGEKISAWTAGGRKDLGMDRDRAYAAVMKEHPDLRQQWIEEVNEQCAAAPQSRHSTQPRTPGPAEARVRELVNERMAKGMTRSQATDAVMKANPELRQQWIDESNAA